MHELPKKVKQGLQSFNQGDFYEAHEFFEDSWRDTQESTRELFRALLHLSGGYYRLTQDRPGAAKKFFTRARHWIQKFPSPFLGLNTAEIEAHLKVLLTVIDTGHSSDTILKQNAFHIQQINRDNPNEHFDDRL